MKRAILFISIILSAVVVKAQTKDPVGQLQFSIQQTEDRIIQGSAGFYIGITDFQMIGLRHSFGERIFTVEQQRQRLNNTSLLYGYHFFDALSGFNLMTGVCIGSSDFADLKDEQHDEDGVLMYQDENLFIGIPVELNFQLTNRKRGLGVKIFQNFNTHKKLLGSWNYLWIWEDEKMIFLIINQLNIFSSIMIFGSLMRTLQENKLKTFLCELTSLYHHKISISLLF